MVAALKGEKGVEDDCTVVIALVPNECVLVDLKNDCTVVAALNPMIERKLKLGLENDCTVVAALNPVNEKKLKLGLENDCTVVAALNPSNESRLKLNQDNFMQGRIFERVAQTPLVLAGTYDTHDPVSLVNDEISHRSNENSYAQVHDENSDA